MDIKKECEVKDAEMVKPLQSIDVKPTIEVKLERDAEINCPICNMRDICYCDYN